MSEAPDIERCVRFADYLVQNYVTSESKFPPCMWTANSDDDVKGTNNGPESFHSHYNEKFYTAHSSIYIFIDVIKQIQSTTYITLCIPSAV